MLYTMLASNDDLDLPQPTAWTVSDVLSTEECHQLIARIEALGPTPATINDASPRGGRLVPEVLNIYRVIVDDEAVAARLYERVRDHVPAQLHGMNVAGANE